MASLSLSAKTSFNFKVQKNSSGMNLQTRAPVSRAAVRVAAAASKGKEPVPRRERTGRPNPNSTQPPETKTNPLASLASKPKPPADKPEKTAAAEEEKKVPLGTKGVVYIGKGKFVKDDERKYPEKTALTGGWAGGETGLWEFREDAKATITKAKKEQEEAKKTVVYNVETKKEVNIDMSKEFGGMVGGWPGGERGIMMYADTGKVVEEKAAPTLGWGPIVLVVALAGGYQYYQYETSPIVEVTQEDGSVTQVKAITVKTPSKEVAPPPEAVDLALKVAPYGFAAAGVGAGVVIITSKTKSALSAAGQAIAKSSRVIVLAVVTGLLAANVVGVL
mmetsp:Transcript_25430/g.48187  ORF Transcript_25430/g.48187 Transcript_25430/m.48187 type:complete len:334 (+) Transcript_25430:51-1052(+)|eukprot:CAMPEP_0114297282 /NCGR_PEP_ID=MMETSP0059-20121206/11772_1 /TAXON_ID=36894 /ORGANISM="Pyramimonas parkeae, Strain CCMP726" /LENGTH=333 /DNA_ID=CAMNT_0001419507 /DNA_START=69 /DNA_END=1070 /DNA_ORIENTATION=-